MSPERRTRDAALVLPLIGILIFLPPYIRIFDQNAFLAGIPVLFIYIFMLWFIGIVLTAIVARRLVGKGPAQRSKEPKANNSFPYKKDEI